MTCPNCQQHERLRVSVYHPAPPKVDLWVEGSDRVCPHRFHGEAATLEAYRAAPRAGDMDAAKRIEVELRKACV